MSKKDEIKKLEEEIKLQELKLKKKKLDDAISGSEDIEVIEDDEELGNAFVDEFKKGWKREKDRRDEEKIIKAGPSGNKGKQSEHDGVPCSNYHPGQTHYDWRNSGLGCIWKPLKILAVVFILGLIVQCFQSVF